MFFSFILVSCFHLSLASWLLFSNKKVQFRNNLKIITATGQFNENWVQHTGHISDTHRLVVAISWPRSNDSFSRTTNNHYTTTTDTLNCVREIMILTCMLHVRTQVPDLRMVRVNWLCSTLPVPKTWAQWAVKLSELWNTRLWNLRPTIRCTTPMLCSRPRCKIKC